MKQLLEEFNNKYKPTFLFFYGHRPRRDDAIDKSCFSQWFPCNFKDENGVIYNCAEQYMMAEKARLFKDDITLKKIMRVTDPGKHKQLGREIKNYDEKVWNEHKFNIVLKGNEYKFVQNDDLMDFLLDCDVDYFIEASPYDKIWGIGMGAKDNGVNDPNNWKGENLLGFVLTELRNQYA